MTDLPVLTEETAKITPTEKNRAGSPATGNRPLLTVVRPDAANHGVLTGPATGPVGVCDPINQAAVGAEIAIGKTLPGVNSPVLQLPAAMQGQIGSF